MSKSEKKKRLSLQLRFALIVFAIMLGALVVVTAVIVLLSWLGVFNPLIYSQVPLFLMALISIAVGTALAAAASRIPLAALREIMTAADRIADGDYSVRLELDGSEDFRQLSDKFNHMAEELSSVEILRTDFVNNFSHEFKTPIVSIRGFARMLRRDDLTDEERNEYLDIIIDESERLTELATSVLNLSRLERQTILTDKHMFNVSEQIRLVIAMLSGKWTEKHIELSFEGKEVDYRGNEDLLKQVWINLLDNAIKFSPEYAAVSVSVEDVGKELMIRFTNQGEPISEQVAAHVFDKFYQGDNSHAVKGNGLGLPIAKKIVELHGGSICVFASETEGTVFEVRLLK